MLRLVLKIQKRLQNKLLFLYHSKLMLAMKVCNFLCLIYYSLPKFIELQDGGEVGYQVFDLTRGKWSGLGSSLAMKQIPLRQSTAQERCCPDIDAQRYGNIQHCLQTHIFQRHEHLFSELSLKTFHIYRQWPKSGVYQIIIVNSQANF